MVEMTTYQGECKYCGEVQPILAMDQIDADEKISEKCACGGAELERRKDILMQNLEITIGRYAPENNYKQMEPEQEKAITDIALHVFHGTLKQATLKIGGSTITITRNMDKTKVRRKDERKIELEA